MEAAELKDVVVLLHQAARRLGGPPVDREVAYFSRRTRDLADELDDVAERRAHPERFIVGLQHEMEKARTVRHLDAARYDTQERRKRSVAEAECEGIPTQEQIDGVPEVPGGFLDFHPLISYDDLCSLLTADNLHWQALQDLKESRNYPDSAIAETKREQSERTLRDTRDRAVLALEHWAAVLKALPLAREETR